jgi:hypothetical protein
MSLITKSKDRLSASLNETDETLPTRWAALGFLCNKRGVDHRPELSLP